MHRQTYVHTNFENSNLKISVNIYKSNSNIIKQITKKCVSVCDSCHQSEPVRVLLSLWKSFWYFPVTPKTPTGKKILKFN